MDTSQIDYAGSRTPNWVPKPSPWLVAGAVLALAYFLVTLYFQEATVRKHGDQARLAAAKADVSQLGTAVELFLEDTGRVPTDAEGLAALIGSPPADAKRWRGPYVKRLPRDPWGRSYVYHAVSQGGGYSVLSVGPDGVEGTPDDIVSK